MVEDSELWNVICDGPFVPTKNLGDPLVAIPKTRKEFNDADRKAIEKNFRAKKILVCSIEPDEYNKISACQSAKEIWEALQTDSSSKSGEDDKPCNISMMAVESESAEYDTIFALLAQSDDEDDNDDERCLNS
uniref:Uncharacterized protein n=1 Tax=Nicotiana tabacum TaxID=4097 RepID=A0A1S4A455_TOBAC|nr:PREDICTED: uncharacterized protein LOC107793558 [Nicotiana tabacum]